MSPTTDERASGSDSGGEARSPPGPGRGGKTGPGRRGENRPADARELAALDEVYLDPPEAARQRLRRLVRLNTSVVPRLRLLGYALLILAIYIYNRQLGEPDWNRRLPGYAAAGGVYCFLSWWLLRRAYGALLPRFDLALAFLVIDIPFLVWAVYLTGADESWLFVLLIFRTADQTTTNFRRALFFAHATTAGYLGLLLFLVAVEGRSLDGGAELTKLVLLYSGNLYLAFTARASDVRRRSTKAAISVSRRLIRDLERQSTELDSARARAELASEAKSEFLANMSHELRTPMNAITGLADILGSSSLDGRQREHLDLLRSSAGDLLSVITDILDFSQIETDQLTLQPTECDLARLVRDVVRRAAGRSETRGLSLDLELDPGLPEQVRVDPVRIRQVLVHLLGNALAFTDQGGIVVRVLEAGLEGDRATIHFEVEDSGIGFPQAETARLFEPFTQADASLTRRHGGTGLGLGICRRLVEKMGGEIGVRERAPRGSVFWFTLPATVVEAPVELSGARGSSERSRARVLVVEDNPVNQLVAVELLRGLGLEVERASDGAEAVAMVARKTYDLVLMDCQMPVMDGYRATAEIRRLESERRLTPIVAVTAHAMEGDRERCLAAGMDDYLAKPLDLDLLGDTLGRWIEVPG